MERALIWTTLICVCGLLLSGAEARWTIRPKISTTSMPAITTPTTRRTTSIKPTKAATATVVPTSPAVPVPMPAPTPPPQLPEWVIAAAQQQPEDDRFYHPAEVQKPRLIEQYDQRHLDGHYEFRYVLSNGDTRYERAYWQPVGSNKVLARRGFYSYPLPNRNYLTVFYTADQNGYHQDSFTYSPKQPVLPRSLKVPTTQVDNTIGSTSRPTQHRPKPNKVNGSQSVKPKVRFNENVNNASDMQDVAGIAVIPKTTAAAAAAAAAAQHAKNEAIVGHTAAATMKAQGRNAAVMEPKRPTTGVQEQQQHQQHEHQHEHQHPVATYTAGVESLAGDM